MNAARDVVEVQVVRGREQRVRRRDQVVRPDEHAKRCQPQVDG